MRSPSTFPTLRDSVDKLADFVDELRAERGLPPLPRGGQAPKELEAKYLPDRRPVLTIIRGGRDDA